MNLNRRFAWPITDKLGNESGLRLRFTTLGQYRILSDQLDKAFCGRGCCVAGLDLASRPYRGNGQG